MPELPQIRWTDFLDIVLVSVLVWTVFSWLRRARSRLALLGAFFLSAVYVAARLLGLQLTAWILQGFSAVLVIVLAVVFQHDLRRLFEQIAVWGLGRSARELPVDAINVLARTVEHQARTRNGALYVIPGRQPLEPHLEGGLELDGEISEPLLLSLFDTRTPGHDGAVVISGSRVSRFAVILPLSAWRQRIGDGGTRHAAALGLAERTDALAVVVSEERGTVSIARDGRLSRLESPELLAGEIRRFLVEKAPPAEKRGFLRRVARRWPEAALSLTLAVAAWIVFVPGSDEIEVERTADVVVQNLPDGYQLLDVDPSEVQVTLRGPRRFLPRESERCVVRIDPDPSLLDLGRRTFPVFPSQVEVSSRISVQGLSQDHVRLSLEVSGAGPPPP